MEIWQSADKNKKNKFAQFFWDTMYTEQVKTSVENVLSQTFCILRKTHLQFCHTPSPPLDNIQVMVIVWR